MVDIKTAEHDHHAFQFVLLLRLINFLRAQPVQKLPFLYFPGELFSPTAPVGKFPPCKGYVQF